MTDVPDDMDHFPPKVELGGAIGRRASMACHQGQHDMCEDEECRCRCHGREWYDREL